MPPQFLYFDLGNVLLYFSHERAARQMAEVAGIDERRVWDVVFGGDLELRYEAGEITSDDFYAEFCRRTGARPDRDALLHAGSDIFEVNATVKAVVAMLQSAGCRTGILSNTCQAHWDYCTDGRYSMIPDSFDALVLSYKVRSLKPNAGIFHAAVERAGVAPDEILFVDDKPENVAGARQAGIDAVLYTTTPQYVADLHARGVRFNY